MSISVAMNPPEWTKQQVIDLILRMKTLDRDYAKFVYKRENARCPEWNLKASFEALKGK